MKKTEEEMLAASAGVGAAIDQSSEQHRPEELSDENKEQEKGSADHVTVVYPYSKYSVQGKELMYALRSLRKNVRFGINVVVIGDHEDWFSEEITFIPHERTSENTQVDLVEKLKLAIKSPDVTDTFILSAADIYFMQPVSMAHIELPKVSGLIDISMYKGIDADNASHTLSLLKKENLPCLNYDTNTPVVFNKELLDDLISAIPDKLTQGCLLTSLYYNSQPYPTLPVLLDWPTDQVLLPVVSQRPEEKKVVELLTHKPFLYNAASGYSEWLVDFLERSFPDTSDFEV